MAWPWAEASKWSDMARVEACLFREDPCQEEDPFREDPFRGDHLLLAVGLPRAASRPIPVHPGVR